MKSIRDILASWAIYEDAMANQLEEHQAAAIHAAVEEERERIIREHLEPEVCEHVRRMTAEERMAAKLRGFGDAISDGLLVVDLIAGIRAPRKQEEGR